MVFDLPARIGLDEGLWPRFKGVWAPDEMYFPTMMSILKLVTDEGEDGFGMSSRSGNGLPAVKRAMVTYVDWPKPRDTKSPKTFTTLTVELVQAARSQGSLFARKFPAGSVTLAQWEKMVLGGNDSSRQSNNDRKHLNKDHTWGRSRHSERRDREQSFDRYERDRRRSRSRDRDRRTHSRHNSAETYPRSDRLVIVPAGNDSLHATCLWYTNGKHVDGDSSSADTHDAVTTKPHVVDATYLDLGAVGAQATNKGGAKMSGADYTKFGAYLRRYDLFINYYGKDDAVRQNYERQLNLAKDGGSDHLTTYQGTKWQILKQIMAEHQSVWDKYKYIWFPDDDLVIRWCFFSFFAMKRGLFVSTGNFTCGYRRVP